MVEEIIARGERTRSEILQAAHLLFLRNGYHGTSMRQIAAEAGIALGGIYNHFDSKEDIFIAVLIDYHPLLVVLPSMMDARGDSFEDFVRDAAERMVNGIDNRPDFLNLMFIELVEFKGQHLPAIVQNMLPLLMEFCQRFGESADELRPIPLPADTHLSRFFLLLHYDRPIVADQLPPDFRVGPWIILSISICTASWQKITPAGRGSMTLPAVLLDPQRVHPDPARSAHAGAGAGHPGDAAVPAWAMPPPTMCATCRWRSTTRTAARQPASCWMPTARRIIFASPMTLIRKTSCVI